MGAATKGAERGSAAAPADPYAAYRGRKSNTCGGNSSKGGGVAAAPRPARRPPPGRLGAIGGCAGRSGKPRFWVVGHGALAASSSPSRVNSSYALLCSAAERVACSWSIVWAAEHSLLRS